MPILWSLCFYMTAVSVKTTDQDYFKTSSLCFFQADIFTAKTAKTDYQIGHDDSSFRHLISYYKPICWFPKSIFELVFKALTCAVFFKLHLSDYFDGIEDFACRKT